MAGLSLNDLWSKPYNVLHGAGNNRTTGAALLIYGVWVSVAAGGDAAVFEVHEGTTPVDTDPIVVKVSIAEATAGHTAYLRWPKGIPFATVSSTITAGTPDSSGFFYRLNG